MPQRRPARRRIQPMAIALILVIALLFSLLIGLCIYKPLYNHYLKKNGIDPETMERIKAEERPEEVVDAGEEEGEDAGEEEGTTTPPAENEPDTTPPTEEPEPEPNPSDGNQTPSGGNDTPSTPSESPRPGASPTFSSLNEIVSYVDSLGFQFNDRASFDMSGCFTDVTLQKTADAGDDYQNETVYIGDSLVYHMASRSKLPASMVYGAPSITPQNACTDKLVTLSDGTKVTFAQAMAQKQPKRIVLSIGTNSMWMEPAAYLEFFSRLIDQLQEACPNAQIILQATPPVSAEFEAGKSFPTNPKINRYNLYLAGLAKYQGVWFLNSAPLLKNDNGTLSAAYDWDGYHLNHAGYDVWLSELRTHAVQG